MKFPCHWPSNSGVFLLLLLGNQSSLTSTTATPVPKKALAFEDWIVLHQKNYLNAEELAARHAIYQANCHQWDLLNQIPGGASYGPEREPHADLTPQEFVQVMANCASGMGEEEEGSGGTTISTPATKILQEEPQQPKMQRRMKEKQPQRGDPKTIVYVDWRNQDGASYVTPPKSQGAHGTCWSFAAAENLEGLNVRQGHPLVNISEQEFISCCPQCQGRSQDVTFSWLVNTTGGHPALEDSYPYDGNPNVTCRAKEAPRAPVQLHSWTRIADDGTGTPVLLGLGYHGPLSLGVDARCFFGYKGGIVRNCTAAHGHPGVNHAVSMVAAGADVYEGDKMVDYFTIKNSWGGKWGEGGYVRIEQGKNWWGPLSVIYTE